MRGPPARDPGLYVGLVLLVLCGGIAWQALDLGLGVMRSPGPGFVFFWTSVFLGVLALRMVFKAARRTSRDDVVPLWRGLLWGRVVGVTVALVVYALVLECVGYLVATALFSAYLFALLADGRRRWWTLVAGAVVAAVVTYLIFDRAFSVQLPKGILGS